MCSTTTAAEAATVAAALPCPLCCQTNFPSVDSLRVSLVSVSSRLLQCPICHEMLMGLDKLTIHLFSHTLLTNGLDAACTPQSAAQQHQQQQQQHQHHHINVNVQHASAEHTRLLHSTPVASPMASTTLTTAASSAHMHKPYSKPAVAATAMAAHCHLCGCVFRTLELHQLHMQLVHEIQPTTTNADDRRCSDTEAEAKATAMDSQTMYQQQQQQLRIWVQPQIRPQAQATANMPVKFQCPMCPKMFKKGSLRVHLRVVHSVDSTSAAFTANINAAAAAAAQSTNMTSTTERPTSGGGIVSVTAAAAAHCTEQTDRGVATIVVGGVAADSASKMWECDICAKWLKSKYFLKKHKRLHTGEMPYTCEHCGKTFTFQQSYHKHLLYHTDEKPHVCLTCGRAFKEMSTLHNHERIHSGEKPFKCETCDKCFRQRVSLLVHQRIHTGVMPYRCTACDKSFRYKVLQRTHKCAAQPPGEVVRQTGDLLQRLIQRSIILNSDAVADAADAASPNAATNGDAADNEAENNANGCMAMTSSAETDETDETAAAQAQQEQHNCTEFANNHALDAFVVEHCNMIGIKDELQQPHEQQPLMDGVDDGQPVPSPSSQFENLCLYSPTSSGGHQSGTDVMAAPVGLVPDSAYTSPGLDPLDEMALTNFMNEIS